MGDDNWIEDYGRANRADGEAIGFAKGKAAAILVFLRAQGVTVSDETRARIEACTDLSTLDRWISRIATSRVGRALLVEPEGLGAPDPGKLADLLGAAARHWLGDHEIASEALRAQVSDILFDGRHGWEQFTEGLATADELRNFLLQLVQTWLADETSRDEPDFTSWITPELERALDLALFGVDTGLPAEPQTSR